MTLYSTGASIAGDSRTVGLAYDSPPFGASGALDFITSRYVGPGVIADTLAVEDPAGSAERGIMRRVTLLHRDSFEVARQTRAGPIVGNGAPYRFDNLPLDVPFMIVADDDQRVYNAVIADWVYAEAS